MPANKNISVTVIKILVTECNHILVNQNSYTNTEKCRVCGSPVRNPIRITIKIKTNKLTSLLKKNFCK